MADSNRQRVGGVIRLGYGLEPQQPLGHLHHLGLLRLTESGDGAFHLQGGVFKHRHTVLLQSQHGHTARLRHVDGGLGIGLEIQLFHRHRIGVVGVQQFAQLVVDLLQAAIERHAGVGGDSTKIHGDVLAPLKADKTPTDDGVTGVDTENQHDSTPSNRRTKSANTASAA